MWTKSFSKDPVGLWIQLVTVFPFCNELLEDTYLATGKTCTWLPDLWNKSYYKKKDHVKSFEMNHPPWINPTILCRGITEINAIIENLKDSYQITITFQVYSII